MNKKYLALPMLFVLLLLANSALADSLPDFRDLAKNSSPAVVNISTEREREQMTPGQFFGNMMPGSPFEDFFNQFDQFFGGRGGAAPRKERSLGSGFVISSDGYIVTNNHVVEKSDKISVNLEGQDGKSNSYDAVIIGTDPDTDLALIKIEPKTALPVLAFGDSDKLEVGEWVIAIGNPFGLDHSVTAGIISAKGRNIQAGPFDSFLQTDASINPGNSGGPLINLQGEVVGINTAIIASGQGIGFAIPINMAKEIASQLQQKGHVTRGLLGVSIQDLTPDLAKSLGLKENKGALVSQVVPGSPADKAGIEQGDVIVSFDGRPIADSKDLPRIVASTPTGKTVTVKLLRDGKEIERQAKISEMEGESVAAAETPKHPSLGIAVQNLTPEIARELGLKKSTGVVVTGVEPGSPAAEARIQVGDVIQSVNRQPVKSVADLAKIVEKAKDGENLLLLVQRDRQAMFVAVAPK